MNEQSKGDILIVDDTPANLQVLGGMLKDAGYKVRPVPSGFIALRAVENQLPDLILLDINMPEINGYETCERLKAEERSVDVPVIFLSALTETEDKVKAFNAGGVDYISKPFMFEEVQTRVETHLRIGRIQEQLQSQSQEFKELEDSRDSVAQMIVQDLRPPLSEIVESLQLLEADASALSSKSVEDLQRASTAAAALTEITTAMLDLCSRDST